MTLVPTCWLPHEPLEGARLTTAAPPVPDREIAVGLFEALLTAFSWPVLLPADVGHNTVLRVQDAPAASVWLTLQVPVPPKAKSAPEMDAVPTVIEDVPVLVRVDVWIALQEPTATTPRLRVVGLRDCVADPPVTSNGI